MFTPSSRLRLVRIARAARLLGALALPLSAVADAQPVPEAPVRIISSSVAGHVGHLPFSPSSHDGVARSAQNPKIGSYRMPFLMQNGSVAYQLDRPAPLDRIWITSSFTETKSLDVDLLVNDAWLPAVTNQSLSFTLGVATEIPFPASQIASAVRVRSRANYFFIDEIRVTAKSAAEPETTVRFERDGLVMTWFGVAGHRYAIQESTDDVQWITLPGSVVGADAMIEHKVKTTINDRTLWRLLVTDAATGQPL